MGTGVLFPGQSGWGVMLNIYLNIALGLRMNRAIPLFALYAFMTLTGTTLPLLLPLPLFARSEHVLRITKTASIMLQEICV
jgi:hypothetical protein